jgi:hypothetical protein
MNLLWPNGIQYECVLLFVTDAASYMIKGGAAVKVIFPNMIHLEILSFRTLSITSHRRSV